MFRRSGPPEGRNFMDSCSKKPGLALSLVPIAALILLLALNVALFKDEALLGPNQIALFLAAVLAAAIGVGVLDVSYAELERHVVHAIGLSLQANLILLVVGMLIGLWIFAGVVPAMIYYGIKLFNPALFLPLTCLACGVVSLATGSSWSTGGTVGIAFVGIGEALGVPPPMVAGAVISGSYFGDKLSPLSDTTNLAPAMAGTDLFTHVRYLLVTTVPSLTLALAGFAVLGLVYQGAGSDAAQVQRVLAELEATFTVTPLLFLLPLGVFALVALRVPALPALIFGCLGGMLFVLLFQQPLLHRLLGGNVTARAVFGKLVEVAHGGFKAGGAKTVLEGLLSRGGMSSMLNTVWLILMAMVFGGVMEVTGMLEKIGQSILVLVRGPASLIAATIGSAVVVNLTAGDQYLSLVLPGRMLRASYEGQGLAPENLSRSLEDGGTITSVLVPWNTCGAYFSTVLGVSTAAYLPFCFFNLLNPIVALLIAGLGYKIRETKEPLPAPAPAAVAPEIG
jgi:NhaC family Na+:H+ antiporter